jgi:xylulokinase
MAGFSEFMQVLGNAPAPGMAGPLALWLSRHESSLYRQARWQLQPKDWLRLRLTGSPATDPTDASATLLFDFFSGTWAFGVAEALGLRTDVLPPILSSAVAAGVLLPDAAAELGLPPGVPVAAGCADTAASLFAADPPDGWGLLTLGTGGQWIAPVGDTTPSPDPTGHTNLFRSVDGVYRLAGAQNVGVALDWVRRTLNASWDELYATAAHRDSVPGPVFDPRLVTERWDAPPAGGGWSGVTLTHGRDDLMRAALTGVAGLLRDRLADLRAAAGAGAGAPDRVLVAGGGSRHCGWRELLAGELGVPLTPIGTSWLTARGATLLAARMLAA